MNGFEHTDVGDAWVPNENHAYAGDFSLDEALFADEMSAIFGPDREDLPPLYTQTLLEDAHSSIPGPGFEQKMAYRVFRRLGLARAPLFPRAPLLPSWQDARDSLHRMTRPVALGLSTFIALMMITTVLASPAFGAGMSILLGRTGVREVNGYPTYAHAPTPRTGPHERKWYLNPTMPLSWIGETAGDYAYQGTQLLDPTEWSKGPIVDMQYALTHPSSGSGLLNIREFQPSDRFSSVLQVVQAGSATPTHVGNMPAVYVDGTWMPAPARQRNLEGNMNLAGAPPYVWESGVRSELIFQYGGVIFWVTADQRDAADMAKLCQMAQMLAPTSYNELQARRAVGVRVVGERLIEAVADPYGREVYLLVPIGTSPESGAGAFVTSEP